MPNSNDSFEFKDLTTAPPAATNQVASVRTPELSSKKYNTLRTDHPYLYEILSTLYHSPQDQQLTDEDLSKMLVLPESDLLGFLELCNMSGITYYNLMLSEGEEQEGLTAHEILSLSNYNSLAEALKKPKQESPEYFNIMVTDLIKLMVSSQEVTEVVIASSENLTFDTLGALLALKANDDDFMGIPYPTNIRNIFLHFRNDKQANLSLLNQVKLCILFAQSTMLTNGNHPAQQAYNEFKERLTSGGKIDNEFAIEILLKYSLITNNLLKIPDQLKGDKQFLEAREELITCPITKTEIKKPLYIRGELEAYEEESLIEWVRRNRSSPTTRSVISGGIVLIPDFPNNIYQEYNILVHNYSQKSSDINETNSSTTGLSSPSAFFAQASYNLQEYDDLIENVTSRMTDLPSNRPN